MDKGKIFENLKMAIVDGDREKAQENAREALRQKIDPLEVVEEGLSRGMIVVGDRFECGEAYLPELLMAANTFNGAMEVLKPEMEAQKKEVVKEGKVLIGAVKGDVHDIGKSIVATIFSIYGFSVVDMGVDVSTLSIIQEAEKVEADVIALSSLMTTTMPVQREVIETLKQMKLRGKYIVIVGGGPVNQAWADEIGADGYGRSPIEGVEVVKRLMLKKR